MTKLIVAFPLVVACGAAPASPARQAPVPASTPTATSTSTSIPTPSAPTPTSCPRDMVALPTLCIDRYEAPNIEGELPFALKTAYDGETWCAARGRRLCTEDEWVRACEGPHRRRYPYGDEHVASACNDGRQWILVHWELLAQWPSDVAVDEARRLLQAERSGARTGCASEEGVRDLIGNVAEWVRRSDAPPRAGYNHVLKGCYWAGCYHEVHPSCAFRNSAHPGSFRTYEAGFRCCIDPE